MPEIAIKIPITIKLLRTFKSSLIFANSFSIVVLFAHTLLSIHYSNFNILASGGGLVALMSTVIFLSYSVPSTEHEVMNYLKTIKPLFFEGGILGLHVTPEAKLKAEQERVTYGNSYMKIQAMYIIWSLIGTILWAYAGYIKIT